MHSLCRLCWVRRGRLLSCYCTCRLLRLRNDEPPPYPCRCRGMRYYCIADFMTYDEYIAQQQLAMDEEQQEDSCFLEYQPEGQFVRGH